MRLLDFTLSHSPVYSSPDLHLRVPNLRGSLDCAENATRSSPARVELREAKETISVTSATTKRKTSFEELCSAGMSQDPPFCVFVLESTNPAGAEELSRSRARTRPAMAAGSGIPQEPQGRGFGPPGLHRRDAGTGNSVRFAPEPSVEHAKACSLGGCWQLALQLLQEMEGTFWIVLVAVL